MAKVFPKEYGDALESFLIANNPALVGGDYAITGLTASNIKWSREVISEPRYILSPSTNLPAIRIRFNDLSIEIQNNMQFLVTYDFSVFYYRQQVPGQDHQELVLADAVKIFDSINNNVDAYRPSTFVAVASSEQQLYQVIATGMILHDELRYDLDCPGKRESVIEIKIEIIARSGLPT